MIDQLRTIGIEKGKPFDPDAKRRQHSIPLQRKPACSVGYIRGGIPDDDPTALVGFQRPGLTWFSAASTGYADPNEYPIDARGVTYTLGFTGIKRLGTAQFYLMSNKDKDGNAFDGASSYRLKVPAKPPVKQYWSLTAYDRETHALIKNVDRASRASNEARGEEESRTDLLISTSVRERRMAKRRTGFRPIQIASSNCLFRLYGPTQESLREEMGATGCRESCELTARKDALASQFRRKTMNRLDLNRRKSIVATTALAASTTLIAGAGRPAKAQASSAEPAAPAAIAGMGREHYRRGRIPA